FHAHVRSAFCKHVGINIVLGLFDGNAGSSTGNIDQVLPRPKNFVAGTGSAAFVLRIIGEINQHRGAAGTGFGGASASWADVVLCGRTVISALRCSAANCGDISGEKPTGIIIGTTAIARSRSVPGTNFPCDP